MPFGSSDSSPSPLEEISSRRERGDSGIPADVRSVGRPAGRLYSQEEDCISRNSDFIVCRRARKNDNLQLDSAASAIYIYSKIVSSLCPQATASSKMGLSGAVTITRSRGRPRTK
jgi:hypothetical protein